MENLTHSCRVTLSHLYNFSFINYIITKFIKWRLFFTWDFNNGSVLNCLDIYRPKCECQIKRNKVWSTSKGRAIRWTFLSLKQECCHWSIFKLKAPTIIIALYGEGGNPSSCQTKINLSFSSYSSGIFI